MIESCCLYLLPSQLRGRRCRALRHRYSFDFQFTGTNRAHTAMVLSTVLISWGWWFYLLSRLCFWAANAYFSLISRFILVPLGYQPLMVLKQIGTADVGPDAQLSQSQPSQCRPSAVAELHRDISDIQDQAKVQKWFADIATSDGDGPNSDSSCLTLVSDMTERASRSRTVSCAAAAAAIALCGQTGVSADAAAAAVGAAAILAQLSSSADSPDNIPQSVPSSRRKSSCCTVPPLVFEVSDELQRELDEVAPAEFLCPLSRVLMTDPVCTPSGFTYQRSYIEAYITKTGHDPARDSSLIPQQLYPNIVVRDQIATWLQKYGVDT